MFRFSLVVCVSLIFGITAKPYKPGNKLIHEAFQDTLMSIDDDRKLSWGVEAEPAEDMEKTDYDVDPRMMIWKSMKGSGQDKQHLKAEEDLDELHHPSMPELLKAQIQNEALPAADVQAEPLQKDANVKYIQKAEEDKDDIHHPVFNKVASEETERDQDEVHVVHSKPEEDKDDLYHRDDHLLPVHTEPLRLQVRGESEVRIHLQPEEDRDHLYHKDVPLPVPYRGDTEAAAPVNVRFQRMYSKPEEDRDHLYHQ